MRNDGEEFRAMTMAFLTADGADGADETDEKEQLSFHERCYLRYLAAAEQQSFFNANRLSAFLTVAIRFFNTNWLSAFLTVAIRFF